MLSVRSVVLVVSGLLFAAAADPQETDDAGPDTPAVDSRGPDSAGDDSATADSAGAVAVAAELPGLDFLEYLGSWQERDDDWLVVAELQAKDIDKQERKRRREKDDDKGE